VQVAFAETREDANKFRVDDFMENLAQRRKLRAEKTRWVVGRDARRAKKTENRERRRELHLQRKEAREKRREREVAKRKKLSEREGKKKKGKKKGGDDCKGEKEVISYNIGKVELYCTLI
jgi:hypothetical protein